MLLGAVGGPKWSDPDAAVRPEQGLLALRAALGVYANLRPVRVHPSLAERSPLKNERLRDVDFVVVRELTGGAYFGAKTRTDGSRHRRVPSTPSPRSSACCAAPSRSPAPAAGA